MISFNQYMVQKNWKYATWPAMFDSNIFCYGKPKSRKTEIIGKPFAEESLAKGHSLVIYANKPEEYEYLLEMYSKTHAIIRVEAYSAKDEDLCEAFDHAFDVAHEVQPPFIIQAINEEFNEMFQYSAIDDLLLALEERFCSEDLGKISVLLDGLCGNTLIPSKMITNPNMNLCVIATDEVASQRWLYNSCGGLCDIHFDMETIPHYLKYINESTEDLQMRQYRSVVYSFLSRFSTIICTGVNNVKPADHKIFTQDCVGIKKLSGRYCLTTSTPPDGTREQFVKEVYCNKIEVEGMDIETSEYQSIAQKSLAVGRYVIMIDGRVQTSVINNKHMPLAFEYEDLFGVLSWLHLPIPNKVAYSAWSGESMKLIIEADATAMNPLCANKICDFSAENYVHTQYQIRNANLYSELTSQNKSKIEIIIIDDRSCKNIQMNYLINVLELLEAEERAAGLRDTYYAEHEEDERPSDEVFFYLVKNWDNKVTSPANEVEEDNIEIPEALRWKPYEKEEEQGEKEVLDPLSALPQNGVLFLGGHQNMTKKLRQHFPDWAYISDDLFKECIGSSVKTVFFWTKHSSHSMIEFANARKSSDTKIIYVEATNINRLIDEMAEKYLASAKNMA